MPLQERVLALSLVVLACWSVLVLLRPRPPSWFDLACAAVLAAGSVWWLFSSRSYEGPTVLQLTSGSGLTAVDLAVGPDLCLAAAVLVRALSPSRARHAVGGRSPGTRPGPALRLLVGRSPWLARVRRR